MDPLTAGVVIGGASLLGGMVSGSKNLQGIRETNAANKELALRQMAFQERMSSTAHTREMRDLKNAGLNPILTATGGSGASAPSGASATMQAPDFSYIGSSLRDGMTSGMSVMQTDAAVRAQNAATAKVNAETLNTIESHKLISENVKGQQITNARLAGLTPHEIQKAGFEAARASVASAKERATAPSEIARAKAEASVATADVPAAAERSRVNKENTAIDKLLEQINSAASIPSKLLNIGNLFRFRPEPVIRSGTRKEHRALERAGSRGVRSE